MALRIGKSIMLNFGNDLEPIFIFAGLAFLLLIGPLLRWYVQAMTRPGFKIEKSNWIELVPFVVMFILSFMVAKTWYNDTNKEAIVVFGSILILIYLHFASYIFMAARRIRRLKKEYKTVLKTKFQKAILEWLGLLIIGFGIIWITYFLNIIENAVPYVVGPIMYSIVIYFLTYKAFQLKTIDIDAEVFKANNNAFLFQEITNRVVGEQLFLEPDISLARISKLMNQSAQKTSEVINQYAKQNFNDFINYYRIQEVKKLLKDENNKNFTISALAFDTGFSSLSSFNSAFKKFEGITPSTFKKKMDF